MADCGQCHNDAKGRRVVNLGCTTHGIGGQDAEELTAAEQRQVDRDTERSY